MQPNIFLTEDHLSIGLAGAFQQLAEMLSSRIVTVTA